jgi:hypothetical protein
MVISAVLDTAFKVDTKWLRAGAICVNVSSANVCNIRQHGNTAMILSSPLKQEACNELI